MSLAIAPDKSSRYELLLLELHRLIAEGDSDSEAAEALRDEMDDAWASAKLHEQEFLRGLSGDLHMLGSREVFQLVTDGETAERLQAELDSALQREDWDAVLTLLRCRPANASPAVVALLRSRAYGALGHATAAETFLKHAITLQIAEGPAAIYSGGASLAA